MKIIDLFFESPLSFVKSGSMLFSETAAYRRGLQSISHDTANFKGHKACDRKTESNLQESNMEHEVDINTVNIYLFKTREKKIVSNF